MVTTIGLFLGAVTTVAMIAAERGLLAIVVGSNLALMVIAWTDPGWNA